MKTFFYTIAFSLFICGTCYPANNLSLLDNLNSADIGEYVVVAHSKTRFLFHIHSYDAENIYTEEVTAPASRSPKSEWREWIQNDAPHAMSWVIYAIDRKTGSITRCYSFLRHGWLDVSGADAFLSTLLTLDYTPVPEENLRRIGPPPTEGGHDDRALWKPRMIVDGTVVKGVDFEVWHSIWPSDGTELSNKDFEIYLPKDNDTYPAYFPSYITIRDSMGKATARVIDSGKGMVSPNESTLFSLH